MSRLATDDVDSELRTAIARRHLSPLDVARAGLVSTHRAAQFARTAPTVAGGRRHRVREGGGAHDAPRRAHGCEVCRSPAVPEGLCETCRTRLSLPLVDPDAAVQAAVRYRTEHPRDVGDRPEGTGRQTRPVMDETASAPVPDVVVVEKDAPGDGHRPSVTTGREGGAGNIFR
jgi:hypothetical protein